MVGVMEELVMLMRSLHRKSLMVDRKAKVLFSRWCCFCWDPMDRLVLRRA